MNQISTKLTKTTFGPEGDFEVSGYRVSEEGTGQVIGVVYKKTRSHHVYGNNGRSPISIGTTSDTMWHFQVGSERSDWSWLSKNDRGYAYTRKDAVDDLLRATR